MSDPAQLSRSALEANAAPPVRERERKADGFARLLLALCLFYGAYALAIALSPRVATFALARSQLGDDNFVRWAVFAPAPFMYNFENRVTISPRPLSRVELAARGPTQWLALNHYPARALTFLDLRLRLFARPSQSYVYLEGRHREQHVVTGYRVVYPTADNGQSASIERWKVEGP